MKLRFEWPFLIGLVLRLLLVTFRNFGFPPGWGGEVVSVATALADGRGFSDLYNVPSGPTAHLLPIYPTFLAVLFLIFGVGSLAAYVAMWANSVLSAATVFPLRYLGERFFSQRAAHWAVWAWALWPLSGHTEAKWIWGTSLIVLLVTSILALADSQRWAFLGFLMGWGALTDSPAIVVAVIVLGYMLRSLGWRKACGSALICLTMLTPWLVRNAIVFHGRLILRPNFGIELARGVAEDELAPVRDPIGLPNRDPQELASYKQLGELEYNHQKLQWALATIRADPARFLAHVGRRFAAYWAGDRELDYLYWPVWRLWFLKRALHLLPGVLAVVSIAFVWFQRRRGAMLFAAVLVLFPAVYYVATASPRYRAPIEPLLLLLSAALIAQVTNRTIPSNNP